MSSLLNKNEYVAIAAKIKFPVEPYIDGEFQQSKAENVMERVIYQPHLEAINYLGLDVVIIR